MRTNGTRCKLRGTFVNVDTISIPALVSSLLIALCATLVYMYGLADSSLRLGREQSMALAIKQSTAGELL